MFNFSSAVFNILLEQDQQLPPWFDNIIKKHNEVFGTNVSNTDLPLLWSLVAGKSYLADRDAVNYFDKIRVLDLLMNLYNEAKPTMDAKDIKNWENFNQAFLSNYEAQKGQNLYKQVQNLNPATKDQWVIKDASVLRAYQKALGEGDKLSGAALTTYDAKSVVDTVQQIINKRISVFTRFAKLKNPKTPFSNLVQDIFKQPEQYLSGQKKYSSDFEAVDDLYIKDIIKVAMAAKDFYASEIAKLKMQQTEGLTNTSDTQMRLPGFENTSLNLFDKFVNSVLVEYNPLPSHYQNIQTAPQQQRTRASRPSQPRDPRTGRYTSTRQQNQPQTQQQNQPQTQQQNQPQQQFNRQVFDKLYDEALKDQTNRLNFLLGKPVTYTKVDNDGKDTGQQGTTEPEKYTVGNIRKMESNEARELIKSLQDIAMYTKKKTGAGGDRFKALQGVAQSIWDLSGHRLYN